MSTDSVGKGAASPAAGEGLDAIAEALVRPMGVDGVYARTGLFEDVVERLGAFISRHREPDTEILRFPPVMSRSQLEKSGFLKSFPNLLGCVCVLHGTEAAILAAASRYEQGKDWTTALAAADLVLTPAACYPLYALVASRGAVRPDGLRFDVAADCFRREPSREIERLQSFRMREYVCIGPREQVLAFRERWIERGQRLVDELGLPHTVVPASDPFFGRVGQVRGIAQLQHSLKFELVVPMRSEAEPTACISFNYHQDHFGATWGLGDASGAVAHTGCVAFGMDRLAVALFARHGLSTSRWPPSVRRALAYD